MSIRLKLTITYIVSLLISVIIIFNIVTTPMRSVIDYMSKSIGSNSTMYEVVDEVMGLLAEIKQVEADDGEMLVDLDFIGEIDERLSGFNSELIVKYKDEYINVGRLPDHLDFYNKLLLVSSQDSPNNVVLMKKHESEHVIRYEDNYYFYIPRSYQVNNEQVVYFILTNINDISKANKKAIQWGGFAILMLIILLISLVMMIIHFEIIKPLGKLEKGVKNISEGNLDFKLSSKNNNEVGRVVKAFDKMREELKKSIDKQVKYEENRKELISSISHDLKTPITSIKGYVEGILDGVANSEEKMARYLKVIHQKSLDMDRLIDDLFLFSKLDLNRMPFDFRKVSMKKFVEDMVDEMLHEYKDEAIIHYKYNNKVATEPFAAIDQGQMKRVFQNIVQNGIKYNNADVKEINITLLNNINQVMIMIQDNGIGMSKDELNHIFEMFYRGEVWRGNIAGGTGLGLAIAKQIVEEHQGEIQVASKKEIGTTIGVVLNKAKEV